MRARHEFTSDKRYYDYLKAHMAVEFVKAAIMSDNCDEDTLCENVVKLCNKLVGELIKDKNELKVTESNKEKII